MTPEEESCYRHLHTVSSSTLRAVDCFCFNTGVPCSRCQLAEALDACSRATTLAAKRDRAVTPRKSYILSCQFNHTLASDTNLEANKHVPCPEPGCGAVLIWSYVQTDAKRAD